MTCSYYKCVIIFFNIYGIINFQRRTLIFILIMCSKIQNTNSGFYSCVITIQMNGNSYYITSSIPCNIDSYYTVITITV